jgi:hypothetical protein
MVLNWASDIALKKIGLEKRDLKDLNLELAILNRLNRKKKKIEPLKVPIGEHLKPRKELDSLLSANALKVNQ